MVRQESPYRDATVTLTGADDDLNYRFVGELFVHSKRWRKLHGNSCQDPLHI